MQKMRTTLNIVISSYIENNFIKREAYMRTLLGNGMKVLHPPYIEAYYLPYYISFPWSHWSFCYYINVKSNMAYALKVIDW